MSNKLFSERLNQELDEIGVPQRANERVDIFAKIIKTPRFQAEAILNGSIIPNNEVLQILAEEFEVSVDWLLGKNAEPH